MAWWLAKDKSLSLLQVVQATLPSAQKQKATEMRTRS